MILKHNPNLLKIHQIRGKPLHPQICQVFGLSCLPSTNAVIVGAVHPLQPSRVREWEQSNSFKCTSWPGYSPRPGCTLTPQLIGKTTREHQMLLWGMSQSRGRELPSSQRCFCILAPAELLYPLIPVRAESCSPHAHP